MHAFLNSSILGSLGFQVSRLSLPPAIPHEHGSDVMTLLGLDARVSRRFLKP